MKLRIKGNTIRVRLSETEVNSLAGGTSVIEETCFPSSSLTYKVQMSPAESVEFKDNMLVVCLTNADIKNWAATDMVSISKEFPVTKGNILSILVEKDFKCLTVRPEDESELYPNPNKHH
jgi:uncharacterized protein DUF7009